MGLADSTSILVEVTPPPSPFGGVLVNFPAGLPGSALQLELGSNPAPVTSVFGRTGNISAQLGDYSSFYANIADGLPPGGTSGQVLVKMSSSPSDAAWHNPTSGVMGNPTALIGMTPINGVLTTGMRSDAAPALDPSIAPTWTGIHTFNLSPQVPDPTGSLDAANKEFVLSHSPSPSALTKLDDNNVTLTLTGNPTTCLLAPTQLTLGWTGTLGLVRGGLGQSGASIPAHKYFGNNTAGPTGADFVTIGANEIGGGQALTRNNDTNVTLTLGGNPTTCLLAATSLSMGWTGTLGRVRGGLGTDASTGIAAHNFFGNNTGSAAGATFAQPAIADLSDGANIFTTLAGENYLSLSSHTLTANAVDLSGTNATGILAAARHPALTGDVTCSAGSLATTLAAGNAGNLNSGTLLAARMPALTGDVTSSAGSVSTTLANIPSATPMAGSLLATNIAAPATPASGKTSLYVDSTSKNICGKNDAGTVNHGIQSRTATANNWIRSIADDGTTAISQPAVSDISGFGTGVATALGNATNAAGGFSPIDGTATFTNKTISSSTNTIGDGVTVSHDLTAIPNQTGGWNEYFVTTTDFTTTTLVAGTDITGLVSGTLTNGAWYEFEFVLRLLNANDANGMKIAFHGAGSGTAAAVFVGFIGNSSNANSAAAAALAAIDTLNQSGMVAYANGEGIAQGKGFFRAAGSGTATMSIQLAKVTGNTATCRVGSVLRIKKAHT